MATGTNRRTDLGDSYPYWVYSPISDEMRAEVVDITPELATHWLSKNTDNRKLRKYRAANLAQSMKDGKWAANGESISFDTRGVLVDGQHRLQAILNSGIRATIAVVLGVDPKARPTVDTGLKRTASDNLSMRGEMYATQLASTIQIWACYYNGDLRRRDAYKAILSHREVIEWLEAWPGIRESVARVGKMVGGGRKCLAPGEVAFVHFAIVQSGVTQDDADRFIQSVLVGAGLEENNPVLALRRRLTDENRPGQRGLDKRTKLALTLKTYQFVRAGVPRKTIKFGVEEQFPDLGIG